MQRKMGEPRNHGTVTKRRHSEQSRATFRLNAQQREIRGARASRVLAKASRLRGLPARVATEGVDKLRTDAARKSVSAGRRNQHA